MEELSAAAMRQGVEEQLRSAFFLEKLTDPEVEAAIGRKIAEKIEGGFKFGVIIFPVYAPFFMSLVSEIAVERTKLIEENGGIDRVEFHLIQRTGEVVVLLKPNPLNL